MVGSDGKVSIVRSCVCVSLFLLMSKNPKLKRVIKSFVPEPKKRVVSVSCFSDSYMFMNICERFPYPYEYVYITSSYLGRIFWTYVTRANTLIKFTN